MIEISCSLPVRNITWKYLKNLKKKEEMESFFNLNCFLNCFVSRAEAELEVFFSS